MKRAIYIGGLVLALIAGVVVGARVTPTPFRLVHVEVRSSPSPYVVVSVSPSPYPSPSPVYVTPTATEPVGTEISYSVTGSGDAVITYGLPDGGDVRAGYNTTLPWSSGVLQGNVYYPHVSLDAISMDNARMQCTIYVAGQVYTSFASDSTGECLFGDQDVTPPSP